MSRYKFRFAKFINIAPFIPGFWPGLLVAMLVVLLGWGLAVEARAAQEPPADVSAGNGSLKITVDAASSAEGESSAGRVSMEFQDANLKDVLKVFSQQTGLNVIASEEVGDRTITLYLQHVTVLDALDQILQATQLTYERALGSQIYIVKLKPPVQVQEVKVVLVTKVYRLKFARVSSSRLAKANEALGSTTPFEAQHLTSSASGSSSEGGGAGGSTEGAGETTLGGAGGGAAGGGHEVGINKIIEKLLTKEGKVVVDERTNSLVVTDLPDNFPRIEAVLNVLDIKTAQILIEAEVLETGLSKLKDLGFKWGTGTSGTVFQFTPAKAGTKLPFSDVFGAQLGGEGLKNSTADPTITLGTLDTSQAVGVLNALETDTDTKVLARPKVLTLDNESAVIRLTSQQAVAVQTTTAAVGSGITTTTPQRMTTGVILVVTPQINEEGFVTMLVEPSVTKTVTSQISSSIVDPKTRSARALVRIRQGETLVLGGLIDRSESESLRKVPILSDVPIIGDAFKNKSANNATSELIVFVTPRILAESSGTQMAARAASSSREQEPSASREQLMDKALTRLQESNL